MKKAFIWLLAFVMILIFVSCSELPGAEVTESESETQTEATLEGETEKETVGEQETESESEWTPIPLSEKISA